MPLKENKAGKGGSNMMSQWGEGAIFTQVVRGGLITRRHQSSIQGVQETQEFPDKVFQGKACQSLYQLSITAKQVIPKPSGLKL